MPTINAKGSKAYEDAIAALRKCADGDDEECAKKAKRMLKAELAEDDAPAKEEPDGDEAPPADDKEDAGATAKALAETRAIAEGAAKTALAAKAAQDAASVAAAKAAVDAERGALLASRPDFSAEQTKTLVAAPIETVRDAVATWPRRPVAKPAASALAAGTRGVGQGEHTAMPDTEAHALKVAMGLAVDDAAPRVEGNIQKFPVMTRAQAAAWHAKRTKDAETSR